VQIRGQRVELAEVEAELAAHPCVAQCAVVAREQSPGGVQLIAYFAASHHPVPDGQELRELLSTRLPSFMVPSSFIRVESLPLTSSGKVDRDRLPAPVSDPEERPVALPRTRVEGVIIEILRELLELDRIGPDDNIFEMGGHSLMAAQLVLQLEDELGVQMDLLVVFDHPTAADLAAAIAFDADHADRTPLERALDG
jgi:acyl carrier protein